MSHKVRRVSDMERYLSEHPADASALQKREPMIRIAAALLELRAALNLTQEEFASMAGLLPSQLSEYEHAATSGVTLQTLCRIAAAAGAGLRLYFNIRVSPDDVGRLRAGVVGALNEEVKQSAFVAKQTAKPVVREGIAA